MLLPWGGHEADAAKVPELMAIPSKQQDDWLDPKPKYFLDGQWRRARRMTGWRRVLAFAGVGCEVLIVLAIAAFLFIL